MKTPERARRIRVGTFLIASLVMLAIAVFVVGRTRSLFTRKVQLHTAFDDASGLVVGAPVQLAGVEVGVVQTIHFDRDLKKKQVHVTLAVDRRVLDRIREDSIARLASRGLLGDALVNITVGSDDQPRLHDGSALRGQESAGLTKIVDQVNLALGDVHTLAADVDHRVGMVFTDDLGRDLGRAARATADITEHIAEGKGLAHELVYDERFARDAGRALGSTARAAAHLDSTIARVDRVMSEIENGEGTLHALVYRDDATPALADLGRAARDLADASHALRSGDGLAHNLLYQKDHSALDATLTHLARVLDTLGKDLDEGRGTVGGLLKDPSVYEDLKLTLGGLQRNALLRWLVRYAIEHDGAQP